ncbi:hypothetical protein [Nitrospirillum amazonense]|uniref:hypothetical protein n=1 Tax=Nitrospirillum amazonense TaxID=28077 RepID=UPI0011AAA131|nr:hypothetical protein [Nitrospirillum amazonense]
MKKNAIKSIIFLFLCVYPFCAFGGWSDPGFITIIAAEADGAVVVYDTTGISSRASCATGARFALRANTTGGQSTLSAIITAHNIKQKIQLMGTGGCTIVSDAEDIAYVIYIN